MPSSCNLFEEEANRRRFNTSFGGYHRLDNLDEFGLEMEAEDSDSDEDQASTSSGRSSVEDSDLSMLANSNRFLDGRRRRDRDEMISLSLGKLQSMSNERGTEMCLRKSVLIFNTMRCLQHEMSVLSTIPPNDPPDQTTPTMVSEEDEEGEWPAPPPEPVLLCHQPTADGSWTWALTDSNDQDSGYIRLSSAGLEEEPMDTSEDGLPTLVPGARTALSATRSELVKSFDILNSHRPLFDSDADLLAMFGLQPE